MKANDSVTILAGIYANPNTEIVKTFPLEEEECLHVAEKRADEILEGLVNPDALDFYSEEDEHGTLN